MNRKFSILVVEDEAVLRTMIEEALSDRYKILLALDGEAALETARSERPDLVLLDFGLPKKDGLSVCEELRRNSETSHIPVIIVSGAVEADRRTLFYEAGADDFLSKPFSPKELIARVESKVRRLRERVSSEQAAALVQACEGVLRCGNLEMDMDRLEVRINKRVVKLSVLEFNLLRYFVENGEKVVSREKILGKVWRDSYVADRTVDTHIASLRKRLNGFDHVIGTVYGAGYILKRPQDGDDLSGSFVTEADHSPAVQLADA